MRLLAIQNCQLHKLRYFETMDKITSRQNPRVKELVKLKDRSHRDKMGKFLIEGSRELMMAMKAGVFVEELYWCDECGSKSRRDEALQAVEGSSTVMIETVQTVFEKVSHRSSPDGVMGVGWYQDRDLNDFESENEKPLFLVLEGVEKPGNLGAIIRSADSAGVDAILCSDIATDVYNPNVIRTSQGQVFSMPIFMLPNEVITDFLEDQSADVVVSTPDADKVYWNISMDKSLALVMGSEKDGVSSYWLEGNRIKAKIPQMGSADSLNLATATTLFLYEALRQRQ